MGKFVHVALVLAVLLIAGYLRMTGLRWGLTSGYGHERNFQPDEFMSLRGVLDIDLPAGQIKAPNAYFEGTFNYYLWALPKAALELLKGTGASYKGPYSKAYADLLYLCRCMSVVFDLGTILIVFLTIQEATANFYPSLVGTVCYAVLPMQVIYAHFMRTHILSNLLCALVLWLSLKLRGRQTPCLLVTTGFISGLAAATRYPIALIAVIPCLYVLFDQGDNLPNWRLRFWQNIKHFIVGSVWLIATGFLIGFFVGHPMLFLDPRSVFNAITGDTLKYASFQQFSAAKVFNLAVIWRYVSYLIPFAMYPLLWLAPYCAILYLAFRRSLYRESLPIMIFSLLYLYFMGKGYIEPFWARITMILFPGFCVLIGIACNDLWLRSKKQPPAAIALASALLLLLVPSVGFDLAYVRAMQKQPDARTALYRDLQKAIGKSSAIVGVFDFGPYFYTVMPGVQPLKGEGVTIRLQEASQPADFFLIGFDRPIDPVRVAFFIRRVEQQGYFKYEKTYSVRPDLLGRELRLSSFPQDMVYPFPTILLFRAKDANRQINERSNKRKCLV